MSKTESRPARGRAALEADDPGGSRLPNSKIPASHQDLERSNSLADLAARLKDEHAAVATALKDSLAHAMAAGDILIEAKAQPQIKHGQWLPWLKSSGVSEQIAQRYMRLARHRAVIEANPSGVTDLGVAGALAMISIRRNRGGDPLARLLAGIADLADNAFDFFDGTTAAADTKMRRDLNAEAFKAMDKIISIVKGNDALLERLEIESARFSERLSAACAEHRACCAAELGITEQQLLELAAIENLGIGDILRVARDPRPGPSPTTAAFKMRDITVEWLHHVERAAESAP